MSVKIGTKFSAGIADGVAIWEVTGKAGRGAWHAVAVEIAADDRGIASR